MERITDKINKLIITGIKNSLSEKNVTNLSDKELNELYEEAYLTQFDKMCKIFKINKDTQLSENIIQSKLMEIDQYIDKMNNQISKNNIRNKNNQISKKIPIIKR